VALSHPSQIKVVGDFISRNREILTHSRVLEIGSYDVNGSIRAAFDCLSYLGIDLIAGPGVDMVCSVADLLAENKEFDFVITCEALEHDARWCETVQQAFKLLAPGGVLLVTCASRGRPEHGTQRTNPLHSPGTHGVGSNHYRNIYPNEMQECLSKLKHLETRVLAYSWMHFDLVVVAQKCYRDGRDDQSGEFEWNLPTTKALKRALRKVDVFEFLATRPLVPLAASLSDKNYQSIAVRYVTIVKQIRKLVVKLKRG